MVQFVSVRFIRPPASLLGIAVDGVNQVLLTGLSASLKPLVSLLSAN
jgi:hypothetical protein